MSIEFFASSSRFVLLLALIFAPALAASAQVPAERRLTIISEPDAAVWINDVRFGTTGDDGRLEIRIKQARRLTIRVRADGFKEATQAILATRTGELKIPLTKTTDAAELAFQEAERQATQDREKAEAAYRQALKARANYPAANVALARLLSEAREYEKAGAQIKAARRLAPANPELSAIEGRVLKESGREDDAIVAFNRAIKEGTGFQPEAHTGLGLLYKDRAELVGAEGDFAAEDKYYALAAKHLKEAADQLYGSPDAPVVHQLLGLVYEKQREYRKAIAVYEDFLKLYPDSIEATAVRSFIVQLKKQIEDQQ
ncbi:MAG: tetratricopeptide repeat protein [Blastocatellia bacterium]|nr:tetratricopeptide repeat protein [Blastocatellia bacterium]